jgi:enoyl-CoA hydratase/carnithine racemase
MSEDVRYEVVDAGAWVTIDRPGARNALSRSVRAGLAEAFERAEHDDDVSVVVLTGAGDTAFCAGGDLKEMVEERLTVPPPDYVPQPGRTLRLSKPLVAAVNGIALAGGFLLAQCADLVVAADHARFGISEAKVGRGAPWAAPLPWLVPPRIAMQLLLTGDPTTAQRAFDVGLVNEVVPPEDLVARTRDLVATIAANAPLSVRAAKEMVYAVAEHGRSEAFEVAERIWAPVYRSNDAQEGPRAFAEKRRPVWQGR